MSSLSSPTTTIITTTTFSKGGNSKIKFSNKACTCFYISLQWWKRIVENNDINKIEKWWNQVYRKLRECSQIVAGPKWINFIRRFDKKRTISLNYDPLSYALNFDDGEGGKEIK
ncbi:hypothetical protein TanjilG_04158 [Lupinus angustifolius]|uniref:Uncharacterized protein n=1 Tax=Lupinus angustifolius TaxID=3871 RepID=A0A4P1RJX0_LUPAN|nr:hypothetical protein TanjilG_04158 [Lupinus angustifolius]